MITKTFEERVGRWQQQVVVKKGKESGEEALKQIQAEMANAAREGTPSLVEYLREQFEVKNRSAIFEAKQEIPFLVRRLTADEARYVPVELEREVAVSLEAISAADAVRPAFWTAAHIVWAEEGLLEDGWASKLVGKDDDATARNVCRYLGGLPHVRGKVSVLADCPLSRAWWRVRMARRISDASEHHLTFEDTHKMLHRPSVWEAFAEELVRRLAVMNEPRALAAICHRFLDEYSAEANRRNVIRNMIHRMASYSTVVNFSLAPFEDMLMLCALDQQETP